MHHQNAIIIQRLILATEISNSIAAMISWMRDKNDDRKPNYEGHRKVLVPAERIAESGNPALWLPG